MTKFVKISLAAAVAVAGLSSTAAAKPMEEAIKGVDVSGMVRYRYEHKEDDTTLNSSTTENDYDLEIQVKAPVNDVVSVTVLTEADAVTTTADGNVAVNVTEGYFTANTSVATIMAGKQGVPGPFDDAETGTGAVALIPAGPVTLAAGHFENVSAAEPGLKNGHANAFALIAGTDAFSFDAWYMNAPDVATFTSIHASAPVGPVTIDARHSTGELDTALVGSGVKTDASLTKVIASGKFGGFGVVAGIGMTGDDNGKGTVATRIALGSDNDAEVDMKVFQASVGALNDATAILLGASASVADKTTVGATYVTVDYGSTTHGNNDAEASELLFDAAYAMSSNFKVSAKYSMMSGKASSGAKEVDTTKSRIEVKYTF